MLLKKVLLVMSLASCVDFQLLKRLRISNRKAYHCFVLRMSIFSNTLYVLYTSVSHLNVTIIVVMDFITIMLV